MLYKNGLYNNFEDSQPETSQELGWLDYLVISNPQGVMKVLTGYGYTGYLAPQDPEEMTEVCYELIDKYDQQAVVDLLKEHPLYGPISEICQEDTNIITTFKNADGTPGSITTTIKTIDYRKLIETALVLVGAFFVAGEIWKLFVKNN